MAVGISPGEQFAAGDHDHVSRVFVGPAASGQQCKSRREREDGEQRAIHHNGGPPLGHPQCKEPPTNNLPSQATV